jgi:hypothetical protein
MDYLTVTEKMNQFVKFIPSEKSMGTSFRIQTNMLITAVHYTLNNYLTEQSYIKYQYSSINQIYRVVVYKNGLVDERFNIQVCCLEPPVNAELFTPNGVTQDIKGQQLPINQLKGNPPTLYVVFNTEIPGSAVISKQYTIYKDLKMVFLSDDGYNQSSVSKM